MATALSKRTPIVDERRFILATPDTGYRSTSAAVAELVDNAIQAGASIVRIFIHQSGVGTERSLTIAVLDNGCGMAPSTLTTAMQFAGSSRFNDRNGLGRFGMGLPNSSVSQARRVDVYTWRSRGHILHSYLDIDEIANGQMRAVPRARQASLPSWAEKYVRKSTGTLVNWTRCDRLDNRKAQTIAEKLRKPLGQRFRYFLWEGNRIYVNEQLIAPFDPLFVRVDEGLPSAQPFGDVLTYEFRVPSDPLKTSTVSVRFTELPISAWHNIPVEAKRDNGIIKGAGVSIVRASREIDYGWYFMGGKRKENYDDWWRCEISFNPELDELFGVTHSKQEINPTNLLRTELSQSLEAIAQGLNSRARAAFAAVKGSDHRHPSAAESVAERLESHLPAIPVRSDTAAWSGAKLKSCKTNGKIDGFRYRIKVAPVNAPDIYLWHVGKGGFIIITVNENHAFHDQVFSRLSGCRDENITTGIESMLVALVRAEMSMPDSKTAKSLGEFRRTFSNTLAAYLGD